MDYLECDNKEPLEEDNIPIDESKIKRHQLELISLEICLQESMPYELDIIAYVNYPSVEHPGHLENSHYYMFRFGGKRRNLTKEDGTPITHEDGTPITQARSLTTEEILSAKKKYAEVKEIMDKGDYTLHLFLNGEIKLELLD